MENRETTCEFCKRECSSSQQACGVCMRKLSTGDQEFFLKHFYEKNSPRKEIETKRKIEEEKLRKI